MEIIDLGLDSINIEDLPSNGGFGAELLMNDKQKLSTTNTQIDLGELDRLESELNSMSNNNKKLEPSTASKSIFGNFFGTQEAEVVPEPFLTNNDLGQATANVYTSSANSYDGFSKINDIPIESTIHKLSDRDKKRKKRVMIKKLEEWYEKGYIKNNPGFNVDSVYEEVEDEYESAIEDKRKKESIKMYGWWFQTFVHSIEYANTTFDPFDVNLDGWGEQVSEDIDSYEEIFSELYEKYKGGKLSPEVALLLKLGFSAAMINFTNKALSVSTPQVGDIMRQNPDLMKAFTKTMTQTMSNQHPAFKFANDLMQKEPDTNTMFGPPPVPMSAKIPPPSQRGIQMTPTLRPDIAAARGMMFQEKGVDITNTQATTSTINRQEMRGPQISGDINDLLSGLKTMAPKPVAMPKQESLELPVFSSSDHNITTIIHENDSMISAASMKEMMSQSQSKMPKRRNARKTSERNTISLDI